MMDFDPVELTTVETEPDWRLISTAEKLNALTEMRDFRTALTSDIDAQIALLERRRSALTVDIDEQIAACETAVKADVLLAGETVHGTRLMAVYNRGRETWDGKRLHGYAAAHPEVLAFRTVGEPSVTIRVAGR